MPSADPDGGKDFAGTPAPEDRSEEGRVTVARVCSTYGAPVLVLLAGIWAYANSLRGEFIFDDEVAIKQNLTIRHLWPLWDVLIPSREGLLVEGNTVQGRPVLNLSFALNYAVGELGVWGYHIVNAAVHLLAGLLLFGIVRRTLLLPKFREQAGSWATWAGLTVALLWVVHPLQTESVTYMSQRAESLAGMLYLLTMYLAVRGFGSSQAFWWRAGSLAASVLGMGVKEVMVTAPLMVPLYDWVFVAGSWRELWRERGKFYLCQMLLGWSVLAAVMIGAGGSNLANIRALLRQLAGDSDAMWHGHEIHWMDYARTQWWAVAHYLRLSFWPSPLVFAYGNSVARNLADVLPSATIVILLLVATAAALWRRHWTGFLGAWFFLILAPTSSVIPLSGQTVAEHRMYLPLVAAIGLPVIGGFAWLRRARMRWSPAMIAAVWLTLGIVLGAMTSARNEDYRTSLSMWRDTVLKWPANPIAHNNYAATLFQQGRFEEAIAEGEQALKLRPDYMEALYNVGLALIEVDRLEEAAEHFDRIDEHQEKFANAQNSAGVAYYRMGQIDRAISHFQRAVEATPDHAEAHNNMAMALEATGRIEEALVHCRKAVEIDPQYGAAESNFGNILSHSGRDSEAVTHYQKALEIDPGNSAARNNLGNIRLREGKVTEAIMHYEKALEYHAHDAEAHNNLGVALYQAGRMEEAISHYRLAIANRPGYADARSNLAVGLLKAGNVKEAVSQLRILLEGDPNSVPYLSTLAWVLATHSDDSVWNGAEAVQLAERARALAGNDPGVLRIYAAACAAAGRYTEAEEQGGRALSMAIDQRNTELTAGLRRELEWYRKGMPFREGNPGSLVK